MLFFSFNKIQSLSSINENFKVVKVYNSGVIAKNSKYKIYISTNEFLEIDDLINLKSNSIEKTNSSNDFNRWLKSEKVSYISKNNAIEIIENKNSLRKNIINYLTRGPDYYIRYLCLILFGIRTYDNQVVYEKIKNISILHLFVVSGFHLNFLIMLINKIIQFLRIKNKYLETFLSFLVLIPYIWIINFSFSAIRAVIYLFLSKFNKHCLNNKISNINILSIVMLLFFVFNPYIVYSLSFIFSFITTFAILFATKSKTNKFKKTKISVFAWLSSLGTNILINKQINLISFLGAIFFSPIVVFAYFVSILFFPFKPLLDNFYLIIDVLINFFLLISVNVKINLNLSIVAIYYFSIFIYLIIKMQKYENIYLNKTLYNKFINKFLYS